MLVTSQSSPVPAAASISHRCEESNPGRAMPKLDGSVFVA
jgi:hypothetical protein